ncbi:inositol monophosphatase [Candidatus Gottesmanbacteria bacterium]|nr:inositol monophosphatase [Candidatus Gottesmanbacteria bacterium]
MKNYREFSEEMAGKAGKIIRENFSLGMKKEWKKDNTPVTMTDKEINRMIIESVRENFPDHGVLGEEEKYKIDSEYVWVCDPVDGTIPFSHGVPLSTFSLALTFRGESILGVIVDPFMNRTVMAEKNKGVYLNGKNIQVSKAESIKNAIVAVEYIPSFPHDLHLVKNKLIKKGAYAYSIYSVSYSGMMIAMGEFLGVVSSVISPWDGAAVKIIVEEAGGKVTDLFGQEQDYTKEIKGFIASNGKVHDILLELLRKNI